MDKKSKILMWILVIATISSIGVTFYKTVVLNDYKIIERPAEE